MNQPATMTASDLTYSMVVVVVEEEMMETSQHKGWHRTPVLIDRLH